MAVQLPPVLLQRALPLSNSPKTHNHPQLPSSPPPLLLRFFNGPHRTTTAAAAAKSGGLRRRSHRGLHGLLPLPQGRLRHPPREILPRLRRLRQVRRLPRPRLVRGRPPLRPRPRQLRSPPLPRPRPPRRPILRLPPPPQPQPHRHRVRLPRRPLRPLRRPRLGRRPRDEPQDDRNAGDHRASAPAALHPEARSGRGSGVRIGGGDRGIGPRGGGRKGRATGAALKDGRVIAADAVVLALGPWSGRLSMLNSLFRVYGLKAHSIVLEPNEPSVITPHALFLSYYSSHGGRPMDPEVYPRPTGEVYVSGMSSEAQVPDDPEGIVGDVDSIKVLKRVAGTVSSLLKEGEARVKAEQACFLPCTDDNKPVIGEIPGVRRCYVATGHSCWGILNGPATGAAMAELVLDGKSSIVDITSFSPARFVGGGSRRRY
ncbi:hypothetical protein Syun_004718 [Stephania yunnanensis]|uniref:FAD dependent oxidoreductase domain-containing protein n=1 Tax=Stephania yunnanensis TaxID=152371 RepID=A0AAP0L406_9MAGN